MLVRSFTLPNLPPFSPISCPNHHLNPRAPGWESETLGTGPRHGIEEQGEAHECPQLPWGPGGPGSPWSQFGASFVPGALGCPGEDS